MKDHSIIRRSILTKALLVLLCCCFSATTMAGKKLPNVTMKIVEEKNITERKFVNSIKLPDIQRASATKRDAKNAQQQSKQNQTARERGRDVGKRYSNTLRDLGQSARKAVDNNPGEGIRKRAIPARPDRPDPKPVPADRPDPPDRPDPTPDPPDVPDPPDTPDPTPDIPDIPDIPDDDDDDEDD